MAQKAIIFNYLDLYHVEWLSEFIDMRNCNTSFRKRLVGASTLASVVGLIACIVLVYPTSAAAQKYKKTFPRLGAYEIGSGPVIADPDFRQRLAKHDILILGMWRGWSKNDEATGELLSIRDVAVDIKRRARQMGNKDIILAKYTAFNEAGDDADNRPDSEWTKLHNEVGPGYPRNNDWWARTKSGEHTSSFPGNWLTNITEHVRRDRNGDTYVEWLVKRDYDLYFRNTPEFDMWFFDNWFYRPRKSVDWDGDGKNDDKNSEAVRRDYRKGNVNAMNTVRKLDPNLIVMGNVDGDVVSNAGMLTEPEFKGKITGLYEAAIGRSYSTEGWGGWHLMMQQYQTTLANAQDNILVMTVHGAANDYKVMRYGLASCLMDDGYFYYTSIKENYRSALWFDEYDVDLGRAIDPPQFKAWKSGVYRRRFENGMVLVNPKGNGNKTVNIGSGYKRIDGQQDKKVNNGQAVSSVSMESRTGLILVNVDGPTKQVPPKPPVMNIITDD